jgi:hypothetical protein
MKSLPAIPLLLAAAFVAVASATLACGPEDDFRSKSGSGSAASSPAVAGAAQAPGVSVSQVGPLAGALQVTTPAEAYAAVAAELAAAREATGENVAEALQRIANARGAYEQQFVGEGLGDPETHSHIRGAIEEAETGARTAKRHVVGLSATEVELHLLGIALTELRESLDAGAPEAAQDWFTVARIGLSLADGSDALLAMDRAAAGDAGAAADVERQIALAVTAKVRENALVALSALEGGKTALADQHAFQSLLLYRAIEEDFRGSVGGEAQKQMSHAMEHFHDASSDGDLPAARELAIELTGLLSEFEELL